MRTINDPRMRLIGRCVDCQLESLKTNGNSFTCNHCGRRCEFDEHGILKALPKKQKSAAPSFYNSPGYQRWLKVWEGMIDDWIIYKNSFYRWFSMSGHRVIKKFIGRCLTGGEPIVDLGCGHGQLFTLLDSARCVGLDANLQFLRVLKKRFPNALVIQGDFQNTPFKTGSLKCAVSLHTLEHLYFLAESLEESVRILTPDGYFLFSIPTEGGIGWKLGRLLVTDPHMKRKHNLKIKDIMDIEHINDAHRTLKFLRFYFRIDETVYSPFPLFRTLHFNSSISGIARPRGKDKKVI